MKQRDTKLVRLKIPTVSRLRKIGTRDNTDDDVMCMILDYWDLKATSVPAPPSVSHGTAQTE